MRDYSWQHPRGSYIQERWFDLGNPGLTYFMGYAAQRERLQLMERTMRGKEQAAKDGRMPATGGIGLYGYDYDPALRRRVINETEADVVRMVFQWASEGISMYRIACMLNEKRIPTKTGKLWSQDRVKKTLQNLAYVILPARQPRNHRPSDNPPLP